MSDKRRRFGSRLGRIAEGVDSIEIEKAALELGSAGPKKHVVVKVQEGETITGAITRSMPAWARDLSPAARARLTTIVVVRNHTRSDHPWCQAQAWAEARALVVAGAAIAEAAQRSGFTEPEVAERARAERWTEQVSA